MTIFTDTYAGYTTWWVEGVSFYDLAVEHRNKRWATFLLRTPGLRRRFYTSLPQALRAMAGEVSNG